MADLTLEILRNREKYADDQEITLTGGETVTVKQLRDALQPREEFTRASQEWAAERKRGETERGQLQEAVEGLNRQLAETLRNPPKETPRPGAITEEDLAADPVLGPIVRDLKAARAELVEHTKRLKDQEDGRMRDRYLGKIETLRGRAKADGIESFDPKAFLDFAIQRQSTDLDLAYDGYTRADAIALARKDAEAAGIEKGKAAAKLPTVPFGRRRPPARPEGLPGSLQELTDEQVLNDPVIQAALASGEEA